MNQPLTGLAATLLILALVFSVSCEPIAPQQPGNSQPPTTGEIADPSLSLRLEPAFASTELLPGFIGPTLAILNYRTMRPAKALPHEDSATIIAYAMLSPPKVSTYQSDFMDPPLLEHFEYYKQTGSRLYDLDVRTYQVVEVDGYPRSYLYLKKQHFHDFFVHCGLHAVPSQDLCTLGMQHLVKGDTVGRPSFKVNVYVRLSRAAVPDWPTIERRIGRFILDRVAITSSLDFTPNWRIANP
jgi:hypothetical protein